MTSLLLNKMSTSSSSGKPTTHVAFVCQKCAQPIKLNKTLQSKALVDITQEVQQKFIDKREGLENEPEQQHQETKPSNDSLLTFKTIPEDSVSGENEDTQPYFRPRSSPQVNRRASMEVVYGSLPASNQPERTQVLSTQKQIEVAAEAFKLMSMATDVDHPLCSECPEDILDRYDHQILRMEEAKRHYDRMGAELEKEVESYKSQMSELDSEFQELRKEEEMLKAKLLKTESHRKQIAAEMKVQREREKRLKDEEEVYWREFNDHQRQMLQFKDDQLSVQYQLQYATEQLNRLKKTNVLNSAFHIWHNGHFGTINGLRLGRLQTVPVEWTEINAAWGQTAFLLNTLARMTGTKFERYNLVPYGNNSFLESTDGKRKILPLYSSSTFRLFTDTKFDAAMVAFLDCLNQLKMHIETNSHPHFMLPYKIDRDKIGDSSGKEFYSIKTQFNNAEHWTKALKFVLTNLRWALTWVAANSIQRPVE